jgi:hypothetical protein
LNDSLVSQIVQKAKTTNCLASISVALQRKVLSLPSPLRRDGKVTLENCSLPAMCDLTDGGVLSTNTLLYQQLTLIVWLAAELSSLY